MILSVTGKILCVRGTWLSHIPFVCLTDVQYVTCRAQMCAEANRNYPFPGYIDISSLVVQDDYIFIQVGLSPLLTFSDTECS